MIKLSDYVFDYIAGLGVKHMFLLPGGGCMHLVDSLGRSKKIKYTCCLHEQAAIIAADAYSQFTGNIGVALVTTGPGGTNAITGVAASWIDSTPLLVLSGQAKRSDLIGSSGLRQKGVQEVDIVSLVKPITKYATTVLDPLSIRMVLEEAVHIAKSGRPGPVWIDIPLDVQNSMVDPANLNGFTPLVQASVEDTGSEAIDKTLEMLKLSERPVILAGNGIRLAGSIDEFLVLSSRLPVPVLLTWKAADFMPANHPKYFGRPGSIGQRGANFIQQNADLIICIGARLDLPQVAYDYKNFAGNARKVIVDIDPAEIEKIDAAVEVRACMDAGKFIRGLLGKNIKTRDTSEWLEYSRKVNDRYPVILGEYREEKKYINTYVLVDELSKHLVDGDVIVPGSSGSCSEVTMQSFSIKKDQRILNCPGLGSMGFGLPACIGACIASGGKRTISIIGDGGLQHNIQEMETLARLASPIKIFILNNNGYASIRNTQMTHMNGNLVCCDPSSGLTFPNTLNIAAAYGIPAERLQNHEQLEHRLKTILECNSPYICDVMINPNQVTMPRVSSTIGPDGKIRSMPMEDLWPFLPREEFMANMIVK